MRQIFTAIDAPEPAKMNKRGRRRARATRFSAPVSKGSVEVAPVSTESTHRSTNTTVSNGNNGVPGKNGEGEDAQHMETGDKGRSGQTANRKPQTANQVVQPSKQTASHRKQTGQGSNQTVNTLAPQPPPAAQAPGGPVRPSGLSKRSGGQPAAPAHELNDDDDVYGNDGNDDGVDGGDGDLDLDLDDEDSDIWTDQRELKLVELYRDSPFLWNKTLSSYQLRHKKDVAYAKFAGILGVTSKIFC